jgi:KaiC/GvpD/RAD55 family RecA-like ATPase
MSETVAIERGEAYLDRVATEAKTEQPLRLRAVGIHDFLKTELPPREFLLEPWLTRQSLVMVHAWRGVGKTWFSLGLAYAIAAGDRFMNWSTPSPRRVLYLDGEMPAPVIQERLGLIVASLDREADQDNFILVTPDLQATPGLIPDLGTHRGREEVDALIKDKNPDLVIIDNLSAWLRSGDRENDAESWREMGGWLMRLRAEGRSVVVVHHSGKNGQQRGTSKREDILDTVISLRRPSDYSASEGACFEVHFEKARGLTGSDVDPFEARLGVDARDRLNWSISTQTASTYDRVVERANLGMNQKEIAAELGINKSNVSRHWNEGLKVGHIKAKRDL